MFVYGLSVLEFRFGLLILSFYPMGSFILYLYCLFIQWDLSFFTYIVFLFNGIFRSLLILSFYLIGSFDLRVEVDSQGGPF